MKKFFFLIYLMALMPLHSFSYDYNSIYYPQVNGIYYDFNPETGEASVESKAYLGNDVYESADYSGHLVIPDSVTYEGKEYRVTGISTKAFYGCTLDGLTIPSSVSSISNRTGGTIHELYISSWEWWCGLSHFGDGELYFYNNLLQKADKVFVDGEECDLTNLNLPDDVTTINDYAFCNIKKIERITIPDGVKSISPYAFYGCSALQEVVLGSGVETISKHAFYECRLLKTLTLSSNLKDIGDEAFDYGQIINLIVPDLKSWCHLSAPGKRYITARDEGVHLFCSANEEITNLVIPEGVTTIARESFCNMNWVKSVSFPESFYKRD